MKRNNAKFRRLRKEWDRGFHHAINRFRPGAAPILVTKAYDEGFFEGLRGLALREEEKAREQRRNEADKVSADSLVQKVSE